MGRPDVRLSGPACTHDFLRLFVAKRETQSWAPRASARRFGTGTADRRMRGRPPLVSGPMTIASFPL